MNSSVKYSIIIPAYNAESTLKRCLDSLVSQKRRDIQMIVIDDGSTDGTAAILKRYPSITVITQSNQGVSAARNRGLEVAVGQYVLFVDSDDYVSKDYFVQLDEMASDCDICYFRRKVIGGKQVEESKLFLQINESLLWEDQMKLLLASREIMQLYNKRFKREIIVKQNLRFIETLYSSEDFNFCLAYSMQCQTIQMYQAEIYFNDLSNWDSLSRKVRRDLTQQLVKGFRNATALILDAECDWNVQQSLLTELDYLYAKCVCSCIAETFKYEKPVYFRNKIVYKGICRKFQQCLGGSSYKNLAHRCLRILLKYQLDFPIYLFTLLVKGHWTFSYRRSCLKKE